MNFVQKFHTANILRTSFPPLIWSWKKTVTQKHLAVRQRELSYRFFPHFHPYVGSFTKRLIKESVRGLEAIDTEYKRNADGTFVVLPGSVRVMMADNTPVALPDGTLIKLADGTIAKLPGANLGTTPNGLQLRRPNGTSAKIMEGEPISLAESARGLRPDGESVPLDSQSVITLLDSKPRPVLFAEIFSREDYAPTDPDVVGPPYPVKDVDFTSSGAYAVYNWEVFYHVPILVAIHLSKNQRFEDAQRWFHYVFDPTDDSEGPTPERFWKVKPFQTTEVKKIEDTLINLASGADITLQEDTVNSIARWKENPFRPHVIARYRQTAYMFKAVTAYLDNLIAWGDSLFRQDTPEAIDEALQIYVLAANILGPRPQVVPSKGSVKMQSYATLKDKLAESWSALVDLESAIPFDLAPYPGIASDGEEVAVLRSIGQTLYFCVPRNDKLLSYWDTVADRLFKIHNSLNIQGIFRQLALFEPPIDPGLLAKAAAAGLDIGAVLSGVNQPLPLVRFQLLAQKAAEICQEVKSLGNNLLAAIEKEDNEAISLLRAQHERVILGLAENVKCAQWGEAIKSREGLEKSLANSAQRYIYYERLLGKAGSEIKIPELEALDAAWIDKLKLEEEDKPPEIAGEPDMVLRGIDVDIDSDADGGMKISSHESKELDFLEAAQWLHDGSALTETLGSGLSLIPQFDAKGQPLGVGVSAGFGGVQLSKMSSMLASAARGVAGRLSYEASKVSKIGSYARREQEWAFQSNVATGEITQTFKQLRAAQIREAIAKREWDNHKQQIKNSEEIERLLNGENTQIGDRKHKKTTTQGFYTWQRREAKALYAQAFQFAFDIAAKAERALKHELGDPVLSYLQSGYLSGKEGLFAAEKLYLDIKRMEMAYHELNHREYELTKHVSLLQLNPLAIIQLRATGRCTITLPEELFDMDGPGHYFRRIKTVAVSIPCIAGPYSSVNCTLTLLKSSIRKNSLLGVDGYSRVGAEDSRFSDYFGTLQSIVTSSGQNDSGLFEANLRDERYLPFEGSGAVSEWQLQLPADPSKGEPCQFDYDTIADGILHLRYTAREGGDLLRNGATTNLQARIAEASAAGSVRLFSIRHEFPSEWAKFKGIQTATANPVAELKIPLREEHYPFWSKGILETVYRLDLYAKTKSSLDVFGALLENGQPDPATQETLSASLGPLRTAKLTKISLAKPTDTLTLYLDNKDLENLWVTLAWGKGGTA